MLLEFHRSSHCFRLEEDQMTYPGGLGTNLSTPGEVHWKMLYILSQNPPKWKHYSFEDHIIQFWGEWWSHPWGLLRIVTDARRLQNKTDIPLSALVHTAHPTTCTPRLALPQAQTQTLDAHHITPNETFLQTSPPLPSGSSQRNWVLRRPHTPSPTMCLFHSIFLMVTGWIVNFMHQFGRATVTSCLSNINLDVVRKALFCFFFWCD